MVRAAVLAGAILAASGRAGTRPALAQQAHEFDAAVLAVAEGELQAWITDPIMIRAIEDANEINAGMTERRIARLDRRWRAEDGYGPMIGDLLDRQASILLRDRRETSNGVITEIIVMDRWGLNAAISDPTSDYYQGDEAKYIQTFLIGPGAVHIGDIEFDDSTQKYQTQVSMTVVEPGTGVPIGAVTFGIDVSVLTSPSN